MLRIPVTATNLPEWVRRAAGAINALIAGNPIPFQALATAPPDPVEGQVYYDTALHKPRVFDGTTWQNMI